MRNSPDQLRAIAAEWRRTHDLPGIVLIQGDTVTGWKTSLQPVAIAEFVRPLLGGG